MRTTGRNLLVASLAWGLACLLGACSGTSNNVCLCAPEDECATDADCEGASCTNSCCGGCKQCLLDADCNDDTKKCEDGQCVDRVQCSPELACDTASDCEGECMTCEDDCCVSSECASDEDCPPVNDVPRYCPPEPPEPECRVCNFVRCDDDAQCADPTYPLYQECAAGTFPECSLGTCRCGIPCGGECPEGRFCCGPTNMCEPNPVACAGVECPPCETLNPEPGGTINPETCALEGADCSCQPLPPLPEAFQGQFSAIALDADGVPVLSGYYAEPYGDLLFGQASGPEAGASVTWTILDGLPADAPCEGAADGPRGGIAQPGDDVGRDTDIAVSVIGHPHIAYFDATHGDLKYAVRNELGWSVHTVDEVGVTGRYSSLQLAGRMIPIIAYMQVRDGNTSAIKLAWSTSVAPSSAADWTIYTLDSVTIPCIPSSCPQDQVCVEDTGTCETPDDPANCNAGAGCEDGEVCVAAACRPEGVEPVLDDIPTGTGLFASLVLLGGEQPVVAYMDNLGDRHIRLVRWNSVAGAFDPPVNVISGGGIADCSLAADSAGGLHLIFMNPYLGELSYHLVGSGDIELVDQGARDASGNPTDLAGAVGELHLVGNFPRVVVDPEDNVRVAYQDGTSLDLVYATRNPAGVWSLEILARRGEGESFTGNYGFFVDQVLDATGETAHVSNFKHNLRTDPWSSAIDLRTQQVP